MKKRLITKNSIFLSLFSLLVVGISVQAQIMGRIGDNGSLDIYRSSSGRVRSSQEVEAMRRLSEQQWSNARFNELMTNRNFNKNPTPRQEYEANMKKAKKYVAPNSEYQIKYKSFLNSSFTGIVKLLPEKSCVSNEKNPIQQCPNNFIYGNGRFFSFRWKDYVIDKWADLENLNGFFVSNGTDNQGILVNLGDVNLESLNLTTKGVEFLTNFVPSTQIEEVGKQYMQIWNEIEVDGFRYAKILSIEVNKTYGLRTIAYERDIDLILTEQQKQKVKDPKLRKILFDPLREDKREDVIIVFRVLEKGEDGSVTIIWKELQRKKSPYIKFEKSN